MSAEEKRYLVYILNSLAAHWMNKARKLSKNSDSRSAKEKEDLITKAVRLYNRGDNFDHMVPITWLGKGLAYLSRAQRDKAREQFQTVYDNVPSSQLAKYVTFCFLFHFTFLLVSCFNIQCWRCYTNQRNMLCFLSHSILLTGHKLQGCTGSLCIQ